MSVLYASSCREGVWTWQWHAQTPFQLFSEGLFAYYLQALSYHPDILSLFTSGVNGFYKRTCNTPQFLTSKSVTSFCFTMWSERSLKQLILLGSLLSQALGTNSTTCARTSLNQSCPLCHIPNWAQAVVSYRKHLLDCAAIIKSPCPLSLRLISLAAWYWSFLDTETLSRYPNHRPSSCFLPINSSVPVLLFTDFCFTGFYNLSFAPSVTSPLRVTTSRLRGSEWDDIFQQLLSAWVNKLRSSESSHQLLTEGAAHCQTLLSLQQILQNKRRYNIFIVILIQSDNEHWLVSFVCCPKPWSLMI